MLAIADEIIAKCNAKSGFDMAAILKIQDGCHALPWQYFKCHI